MYKQFYGLRKKPFHIVPNPEFLYLTSKHRNALTYLEYGITEGVGFVLLTGEIGTGKTTLIRHILSQIESDINIAMIFNTNVSAEQLLCLILQEFELTPEKENKAANLDMLYQFLIDNYTKGTKVLLVIDEAQNLSDDALEEVRMLSNLHTDEKLLLQIMLVGQPELKFRLQKPNLAQLTQRIIVSYHLIELSSEETEQYIRHRLQTAGGRTDLFTPEAMALIHRTAAGIPRSINILCDTALVYGFADELETIDVPVIEQLLQDRGDMGRIMAPDNITFPSQGNDDANQYNGNLSQRLQNLEEQVRKLEVQLGEHLDELAQRAENFKDELVEKLKNMIDQERQRNDKLLSDFSQLQLKYEAILRLRAKEVQQSLSTDKSITGQ